MRGNVEYTEPSGSTSAAGVADSAAEVERGTDGWHDRVRCALESARSVLLSQQREDGHWCGELEGDSVLESEYALTLHFLGRGSDQRIHKAAAHLRQKQLPEGGWCLFPGGPADASASVKAYFVLKLVGDDPESSHMFKVRQVVQRLGGLEVCNTFTKILLAIFGQYPWDRCPAVPPEMMLLPRWFPFNIYAMSAWSRTIVVPLSIIWACKPRCEVPEWASLTELATGDPVPAERVDRPLGERLWRRFFTGVDVALRRLERLSWHPWRKRAVRRATTWMIERLEQSDGLGAIFPPILNTIFALRCLGHEMDSPILQRQIHELEKLVKEDDTLRVQPCFSPVWDTALSLSSLLEAGIEPQNAVVRSATRWLLDHEVTEDGDWRISNPNGVTGGWYFEYANEFYPDCDDTSAVLTALAKTDLVPHDAGVAGALRRGTAWLLSMQNEDGGWAAFDRGCDRTFLTYIPFADHNAMIDPSTVDITSRVLESLARLGYGVDSELVQRGVRFVLEQQEDDGSWYGRWGCNYLYGTWLALCGLRSVGLSPGDEAWGRRAVDWLCECQNEDGGWGELPFSYERPALKGQGPSTASQTAWAVMGLLAGGQTDSEAVRGGVESLLRTQRPTGDWGETHWTGTGFPKVFYLRYHYYAMYFPLSALSAYQKAKATGQLDPRRGEWVA